MGESFLVPQFWIIASVTCTVLRMNSIMVALCFLVVHIKYLCILVGVPMFTITQLCYTKFLFEKVLFYGNWLQLSLNSSPFKSYTCCKVFGHPTKGWSCSLWLNLHNQEGDSTASLEKLHPETKREFSLRAWSLFPDDIQHRRQTNPSVTLCPCRTSSSPWSRPLNLRVTTLPPI